MVRHFAFLLVVLGVVCCIIHYGFREEAPLDINVDMTHAVLVYHADTGDINK